MNAVTWGVFRGREVIQPTVVDHQAFLIWKNEALKCFIDTWATLYKPRTDKNGAVSGDEESINFLKGCSDNFYLINIVDNDFIEGQIK